MRPGDTIPLRWGRSLHVFATVVWNDEPWQRRQSSSRSSETSCASRSPEIVERVVRELARESLNGAPAGRRDHGHERHNPGDEGLQDLRA
jgi:hypothetical protein